MKKEIENFELSNIPEDMPAIESDESKKKRNDEWKKKISKDPYIYEALQIIEDWN
jgi:hypothetical protein